MPRRKKPELTFQQHVADHLVREHGYGVMEQSDITDREHFIAEDHLRAFRQATQADMRGVMASTDPRREENFCWHNLGQVNTLTNPSEYPVEFLYCDILSKEQLLEALACFLVRVP
jgi:hypothetical protein